MPIQIPLWLENNTGSEWKKFVSDAQSAGLSVMQIMEAQQVAIEKVRKAGAGLGENLGNRTAQKFLNPDREQIVEMSRDFGHVRMSALEMKAAISQSSAATQALGKSGGLIAGLAGKINWVKAGLDLVIWAGNEAGNVFEMMERRGDQAARNLKTEWDHLTFSLTGGKQGSESWADGLRESVGKSSAYQGLMNWGSEQVRDIRDYMSYGRSSRHAMVDWDDRFLPEPQREFKAMVQADQRRFAEAQRSNSKNKADELFKESDEKEETRKRRLEIDAIDDPNELRRRRNTYRHEAEMADLTLGGGEASEKARVEDYKRSLEYAERLIAVEEHRRDINNQIQEAEKWDDAVPRNMELITSLDAVNNQLEGVIHGIRRRVAENRLSASEEKRLMGDLHALTSRGIALQQEQENTESRLRRMRTEYLSRPIEAEDVGNLANANRLLERQIEIYQAINRNPLAERDHREEQERLVAQQRGMQQQFQQQQRQTAKFIHDTRRDRNNTFDASVIDDVIEASVMLSDELNRMEALNQQGLLTAEDREVTERRIQEIYARQKSLVQERKQLQEQERDFGKSRQAEISEMRTMNQIEQMRDTIQEDIDQKLLDGLLTTREELRLRQELLAVRERELAIARDTAKAGIEVARAEFQKIIQKRATQFGKQGGIAGPGMALPGFADQIRQGINRDDTLKQLARNRAKDFAAQEEEGIVQEALRQQDAGPKEIDPTLRRRFSAIRRGDRERQLYLGQLAGLRRGTIRQGGRGFRGFSQAEFQKAQNDVALGRTTQIAEAANLDLVSEQGLHDAVESSGEELMQTARFHDAMHQIRSGGGAAWRNRKDANAMKARHRRQNMQQQIPERVDNLPLLLQGAAQQQAGAFNAQHGLNQQLVQGFQQAQQSALAAMHQADRLAEEVRALINQGNARARTMKGY